MRLLILYLASLVIAALLGGCSARQLPVQSDYDHAYRFRQLHSWNWAAPARAAPFKAPFADNERNAAIGSESLPDVVDLDDTVTRHRRIQSRVA